MAEFLLCAFKVLGISLYGVIVFLLITVVPTVLGVLIDTIKWKIENRRADND